MPDASISKIVTERGLLEIRGASGSWTVRQTVARTTSCRVPIARQRRASVALLHLEFSSFTSGVVAVISFALIRRRRHADRGQRRHRRHRGRLRALRDVVGRFFLLEPASRRRRRPRQRARFGPSMLEPIADLATRVCARRATPCRAGDRLSWARRARASSAGRRPVRIRPGSPILDTSGRHRFAMALHLPSSPLGGGARFRFSVADPQHEDHHSAVERNMDLCAFGDRGLWVLPDT